METLERAYRESRKGKTKKKLVKMVDENPEFYLKQIQDMLINKSLYVKRAWQKQRSVRLAVLPS